MDAEFDKNQLLNSSSSVWLRLPSAPVFMCVMRTIDGRPVGMPVWKSFENRPDERSMENETVSSTLLNLTHILSLLTKTKKEDGESVMKISYADRTWSIYMPASNQPFQVTFIVAFEETDKVQITSKDREVLTKEIVNALAGIDEFKKRLKNEEEWIVETHEPLYKTIMDTISETIYQWDKKRIKYLQKEADRIRKQLREEAKAKRKQEEAENAES